MEKLRGIHTLGRGEHFLSVWKHQAPRQERFAGIDLQELEADVGAAQPVREHARAAKILLRGLRLERDSALMDSEPVSLQPSAGLLREVGENHIRPGALDRE